MKIKHYYTISKAVLFATRADDTGLPNHTLMSNGQSHWIDLDEDDDGITDNVFICGDFHDENVENLFAALPSCIPLPHLVLQGNQPLDQQKHIKKLAKKLKLKNGDTAIDAVKAAGVIHPCMRIAGYR
jgi:hypothetical protein